MKILKVIGIALGTIIALFLLVAAFLPSTYKVERTTEFKLPVDSVYDYVADLNNFAKWNAWSLMEPDKIKISVTGNGKDVGSAYAWEGEKTGQGKMTTTAVDQGKYLEYKMNFYKPMEGEAKTYWNFQSSATGTKATWVNEGPLSYPIGRYFGLGMDKMLGDSFEKSFANLKAQIEK